MVKVKLSNEAKKLAQELYTGISNAEVQRKLEGNPEKDNILAKIENIRTNIRNQGRPIVIPQDEPEQTMAKVTSAQSAPKGEGVVLSLSKAVREWPEKKQVRKIKTGNNAGKRLVISTHKVLSDTIGAKVSVTGAKKFENNDFLTLEIGSVRIIAPKNVEINADNILSGKFELNVVATNIMNESGRKNFYLQLKYARELNGEKPVFAASIDKQKIIPTKGSIHTTPTFNGEILHLVPIQTA